ncbi:histidine phosphatase family protein [Psychrobacter sp. AOP22-C1-22]|uniref:histidine phosphatase family protein n=1 Tax=unclassified Psychrobacter TaxID=196806 RepID=UPI001787CE33|nr:histidine phosphatase family protein [Psychrobacter sp. FME6]MBE0405885.1 histidine phosphatase family protein [Psychrobacter sp. FME6]
MIVHMWRHPKPIAAEGFCIGQTDLSVDRRKLKRLANKIQRFVRLHRLPKVIWVSPLQRSLRVGQILAQRGFECRVSKELAEIDFGIWDGQAWAQIEKQEIDDWCDNFANFSPAKGESLQQLFDRVERWLHARVAESGYEHNHKFLLMVGHAGWINAAKMIAADQEVPKLANKWPRPVNYQSCSRLEF